MELKWQENYLKQLEETFAGITDMNEIIEEDGIKMIRSGFTLFEGSDAGVVTRGCLLEVNGTVGAGDSMVAGFLAGFSKTKDSYRALRLGSAAGNATAFANGLAKGVAIKELEEKIEVKVI